MSEYEIRMEFETVVCNCNIAFTKEILNGKLRFLCNACNRILFSKEESHLQVSYRADPLKAFAKVPLKHLPYNPFLIKFQI